MLLSPELDPQNKEAIEAAMNADWEKAVNLNLALLKKYPKDIGTLNRLALSYFESGSLNKSKATYKKVLKLDPYNSIATKNLHRLSTLRAADLEKNSSTPLSPELFLEEPGKTKVVALEDLAMNRILARLRTGDILTLNTKRDEVILSNREDERIGKLPKIWSKKIATVQKAGSKFSAIVKAVKQLNSDGYGVDVLIRETQRGSKVTQAIFPSEIDFVSFVKEDTLSLLTQPSLTTSDEEEAILKKKSPESTSLETLREQEAAEEDEENE
ncbi:hypothetical protein A2982_03235 [candidate division WWE3 bacterium RIFCSPLOWO2_01_FULL_39_13]|uniref:Uncharacterized protein n=1 Tax=candidate division WWE3 bacterium RIFCSPLOWO2_01_FULL_39_13 TaxID=1802624 RepID=A0A1F4V3M7_UNCKA|nr:MAG: hypothetical protein A2982_03235 [candidate division WWE3 bacterium RIFCSPLOWO2_01_FULL_39_13]